MIHGRLAVTVEPEAEPVSLDDIYTFLRLTPSGSPPMHPDDTLLRSLIKGARQYVERSTRRALMPQTIKYAIIEETSPFHREWLTRYYAWPFGFFGRSSNDIPMSGAQYGRIELFRPPCIDVVSVEVPNADGTTTVIDPATYRVVTLGMQPAFIEPLSASSAWSQSGIQGRGLEITYRAGYLASGSPPDDADASAVPDDIKTAIKMWVQKTYDPLTPDQVKQYESAIDMVCAQNQVYSF